MKTLTKITLTAMMIIVLTNVTTASNFKMFRMYLSEGKSIEVFIKVESLVEENLPVIHNMLKRQNSQKVNQTLILPVKEEQPIKEDIVTVPLKSSCNSDVYLGALVSELSRPEKEADDLDFDTQEVFESYMADKQYELTPDQLKQFVKKEHEVKEDATFLSLMQVVSK